MGSPSRRRCSVRMPRVSSRCEGTSRSVGSPLSSSGAAVMPSLSTVHTGWLWVISRRRVQQRRVPPLHNSHRQCAVTCDESLRAHLCQCVRRCRLPRTRNGGYDVSGDLFWEERAVLIHRPDYVICLTL